MFVFNCMTSKPFRSESESESESMKGRKIAEDIAFDAEPGKSNVKVYKITTQESEAEQ